VIDSADAAPHPPNAHAGVVVCDLDGVIWLGDEVIAGASDAVTALRAAGVRVGFATNNSSLTIREYCTKLAQFGIDATAADIVTSGQAAAALLQTTHPAGSTVLACAGEGVVEALVAAGFVVVDEGPCSAVVVGWHRTFDFERLRRAAAAVRGGARFVATNADPTYPAPDGLLPGAGALVAAVATAAECTPDVAGKPYPPMVALVRDRFGSRGVMIGDRPSTDGRLAGELGWPFVLVSSAAGACEPPEPGAALAGSTLGALVDGIVALADSARQRG
jgi:4-nitrophenyl phosphatase